MLDTLRHIDHTLFHFINHSLANPILDVLCPVLRNKLTWVPLYVFMGYMFYKRFGNKILLLGCFAAITVLFTDQISASLIKPVVHRLRPCNNPEIGARLLLSYCGAGYSFVSSHAANHFGIAMFIIPFLQYRRMFGFLLLLWASLVSFSQVYVGVHFPADVFAGALLGIFTGFSFAVVARKYFLK